MIEEGTVVYYLDEDAVHSGRVIDVTPETGDSHAALTVMEHARDRT